MDTLIHFFQYIADTLILWKSYPMGKITLLLIDDHKLIRDSWSIILNADPRFEVIGETNDVDQALSLVKKLNPDIILMDINMVPVNGFEDRKIVV